MIRGPQDVANGGKCAKLSSAHIVITCNSYTYSSFLIFFQIYCNFELSLNSHKSRTTSIHTHTINLLYTIYICLIQWQQESVLKLKH